MRRLAWTLLLASATNACGGDEMPVPQPPPWDDDRPRLGHCTFEPAPARAARPPVAPAPLSAGLGSARLDLPIGTPLGAYGGRVKALGGSVDPDARALRWATGMTPSVGTHDVPMAQALALRSGEDTIVLVRVDAPLVTENVLFELERAVDPSGAMRGRILLSASHSHAAWGAWLPTVYLAPGTDTPRHELMDRAVASLAEAVRQALSSLEPARIGLAVDTAFDPDDRVTSDRRSENDEVAGPDGNHAGAGKDAVVWAMRVDDGNGQPMAALIDLPIHGTVGGAANPLASSDAPGAIARALESELGYPVLHLQGVTGDITPASASGRERCVDELRCLDMPGLEMLAARATELVAPLVTSIATEPEAAVEMVTRTFAVGRGSVVERPDGTQLYYLPPDPEYLPDRELLDADGSAKSPFDEFNTVSGAGLCGEPDGITFAPLPGITGLVPYSSCIDLDKGADIILGIFEMGGQQLPLCDSVRSTGVALRIAGLSSGDWLLVGVPGEPTAPFAAYLRARSPAGPDRTLIIGYADEYSGYMLTGEDWLAGGYECSTNVWGPREGEQILEALLDTSALAWTAEIEDPEEGLDRFEAFEFAALEPIEAGVTSNHGSALASAAGLWWPDVSDATPTQADAQIARAVGVARFAWYGGDPAVDAPRVTVERELTAGQFEPLVGGDGHVATSDRGVVVLSYTPEPIDAAAPSGHRYAASWQPTAVEPWSLGDVGRPLSLPTGRYRLVATGRARAASGVVDYVVPSPTFEIVAAPLASLSSAVRGAGSITLTALLEAGAGLRALRDGPSDVELPLLGPWQVVVTFSDLTTQSHTLSPVDGVAELLLSATALAAATSVEIRDDAGNGGSLPVR